MSKTNARTFMASWLDEAMKTEELKNSLSSDKHEVFDEFMQEYRDYIVQAAVTIYPEEEVITAIREDKAVLNLVAGTNTWIPESIGTILDELTGATS